MKNPVKKAMDKLYRPTTIPNKRLASDIDDSEFNSEIEEAWENRKDYIEEKDDEI